MSFIIPDNIHDLVTAYKVTKSGHFFDESTMKFFKSRLTEHYLKLSDKESLFITTEKTGLDTKRSASVRRASISDGRISITTEAYQVGMYAAKKYIKGKTV
jgi:hypothetical protein